MVKLFNTRKRQAKKERRMNEWMDIYTNGYMDALTDG
jgi:hypothetical protein